jgi:hypothetical protein
LAAFQVSTDGRFWVSPEGNRFDFDSVMNAVKQRNQIDEAR